MATMAEHHEEHGHGVELTPEKQVKANRLGLWLFFVSEIFLFGAILAMRFFLWEGHRPPLSQEIGLFTTTILLLSSFFVYRGETAIEHGDAKRFTRNYMMGAICGILFFIGVVFLEWNIFNMHLEIAGIEVFGHLKPTDGVFGGIFFAMTGIHALHVISGIGLLLVAWYNGRKNMYSMSDNWGVEGTALYWHYVDVIWVFFYPALYLVGTVAAHP
jgi:cytochrome c oxidase subunit III